MAKTDTAEEIQVEDIGEWWRTSRDVSTWEKMLFNYCHICQRLALGDTASFKKMNIFFEWIFRILKKWIIFLNEYSGFWKNEYFFWMNILDFEKNEYFFWMNILDFYKMNNFFNKNLGFSFPLSKWLSPNVSNSSEIIQGSLVGPISVHFRGSL